MGQGMTGLFLRALGSSLRVVWPILGFVLTIIISLGIATALVEGWTIGDGIYFSLVTSLTIGYGDITAKRTLGRVFSILIGFSGIVFSGMIAAIAIYSLRVVLLTTHSHLRLPDPPGGDTPTPDVRDSSYPLWDENDESKTADPDK